MAIDPPKFEIPPDSEAMNAALGNGDAFAMFITENEIK